MKISLNNNICWQIENFEKKKNYFSKEKKNGKFCEEYSQEYSKKGLHTHKINALIKSAQNKNQTKNQQLLVFVCEITINLCALIIDCQTLSFSH